MAISSSKWRWLAGFLLVLVVGAWLTVRYGGKRPAASQAPPVVVTTTLVQQAQLDQAVAQKAKDKSQLVNAQLDRHQYGHGAA